MDFKLPVRNIRDFNKSAYENYMPEILSKSKDEGKIIKLDSIEVKGFIIL